MKIKKIGTIAIISIGTLISFSLPGLSKPSFLQKYSLKNPLNKDKWNIKATYRPPISPIRFSCDNQGNFAVGVSPGINTPVGRFGVDINRKMPKVKKCPKLLKNN